MIGSPGLLTAGEATKDRDTFIFHSHVPMTEHHTESAGAPCADLDLCPVIKAVAALPGISSVTVRPYVALVTKGALYNWDDLGPQIVGIIKHWNVSMLFDSIEDFDAAPIRRAVDKDPQPAVEEPAPEPQVRVLHTLWIGSTNKIGLFIETEPTNGTV